MENRTSEMKANNSYVTMTGTWVQTTSGGNIVMRPTTNGAQLDIVFLGSKFEFNCKIGVTTVTEYKIDDGAWTPFTNSSMGYLNIFSGSDEPHTVSFRHVSGPSTGFEIYFEPGYRVTSKYCPRLGYPLLSEARLYAIAKRAEAMMPTLVDYINAGGLGYFKGETKAEGILIGAQSKMWDMGKYGNILVQIGYGSTKGGTDFTMEPMYVDWGAAYGNLHTYFTPIEITVHQKGFNSDNQYLEVDQLNILRSRMSDWARHTFNVRDTRMMQLWSRERGDPAGDDWDYMSPAQCDTCTIDTIRKGADRSDGIYVVELLHKGAIP